MASSTHTAQVGAGGEGQVVRVDTATVCKMWDASDAGRLGCRRECLARAVLPPHRCICPARDICPSSPGVTPGHMLMPAGSCNAHAGIVADPTEGTRTQTDAALRCLLDALAHCHAHGVVHCDVKPSNLVRTAEGGWALIDFGSACVMPGWNVAAPMTSARGTTPFAAPEMVAATHRGTAVLQAGPVDMWSFGVTALTLWHGGAVLERPIPGDPGYDALMSSPKSARRHKAWHAVPVEWHALLRECLQRDPGARPTAAQALLLAHHIPLPPTADP
jgi:hypothetical protein